MRPTFQVMSNKELLPVDALISLYYLPLNVYKMLKSAQSQFAREVFWNAEN